MGASALQQGATINFDKKCFILLRKITDDLWQLEDVKTKRVHEYTDDQLRSFYVSGQLTFVNPKVINCKLNNDQNYLDIAPEQWERAKIKRAYVMATLNIPNTRSKLKPVIYNIWNKLNKPTIAPNAATVIRWKNRFIASGNDITSVVERHDMKGNRTPRYPEEVIEFVQTAIDTKYLTSARKTIQDTYDEAYVLTDLENKLRPTELQLPYPTRRLVLSQIRLIPAFDRYAARHGRTQANNRFRSVLGHRTTLAPLERAEIDHTPLDLIVIDDKTNLPLGRPWVTACIDDYSRCLLGIYIGFEPPSYLTVAYCLKEAFLPKTNLKEKYPLINNAWEAHGVMRELVVDNGREFHSDSLENACYTLGIEIHYSPRKEAWFKGKIERFLKTLNGAIAHGTPGTTFSNIIEKEDYDPCKDAVVRWSMLRKIAYKWVADVYHQRPHRTLHIPPAIAWKNSISPENILLPDNPAQLDAILGRSETRKLTHKGIEFSCLLYNSKDLATLRRQMGDRLDVEIRVNEADLGHIYVLSPDKIKIFKVPALFFEYANGLSSWQHKVLKNFAARELKKIDPMSWLQAKHDLAKLIEVEFMLKKRKTRSRVARFKGDPIPDAQPEELPDQHPESPEVTQEPESGQPQVGADIPENIPAQQSRPKRKLKPEYRERSPQIIEIDQSGIISTEPPTPHE